MKENNQEISFYLYTVRAKYRGFVIAKRVKSENQHNAVIDFLKDLVLLADYRLVDDIIFILSVEQEGEGEEE